MAGQYARGEHAWGVCGRSGRKMLRRNMIYDGRYPNMLVDPAWFEARHPLETMPAVEDPVALYRPAPEVNNSPMAPVLDGYLDSGSVVLTWTWALTSLTGISSYQLWRQAGTDEAVLLATCEVQRDFLGGITGVSGCTIDPAPAESGPLASTPKFPSVIYEDDTVVSDTAYQYYVIAFPMGNNQYHGQGAQSAPSNVFQITL